MLSTIEEGDGTGGPSAGRSSDSTGHRAATLPGAGQSCGLWGRAFGRIAFGAQNDALRNRWYVQSPSRSMQSNAVHGHRHNPATPHQTLHVPNRHRHTPFRPKKKRTLGNPKPRSTEIQRTWSHSYTGGGGTSSWGGFFSKGKFRGGRNVRHPCNAKAPTASRTYCTASAPGFHQFLRKVRLP